MAFIMTAVRIHRKLESETLHLPELKPLIGRTVEIIVREAGTPAIVPGVGDWDDALQAGAELEDYDFEAYRRQREYDARHGRDHLP